MFRGSKLAWALGLTLVLSACGEIDEPPLERLDLGVYVVRDFKMPFTEHGASADAQRMLGRTMTLSPSRILFPQDFGQADCQHDGFRLTQRPLGFIPSFELGSAGPLSPQDAGIEDRELLEVWNGCVHGAFMSLDHQRLYLPGRGALYILEKY